MFDFSFLTRSFTVGYHDYVQGLGNTRMLYKWSIGRILKWLEIGLINNNHKV